jgi:hypothetical protein
VALAGLLQRQNLFNLITFHRHKQLGQQEELSGPDIIQDPWQIVRDVGVNGWQIEFAAARHAHRHDTEEEVARSMLVSRLHLHQRSAAVSITRIYRNAKMINSLTPKASQGIRD